MVKKFIPVFLLASCLAVSAAADLNEAVRSFNKADYQAAYPELKALSEEGNPVAAYYMGRMYREGLGMDVDADKAVHYFEMADRGHYPDAAVALGQMVIKGEGTLKDLNLGEQYLKKAAYVGNNDALYALGEMYEQGEGVEKNYTYAFGFFYMAALKGDARAQLKAAQYYLNGRGIPQDYKEAVKWYTRSSNQGYTPAQREWAGLRADNPRLRNLIDAYSWFSILAAYNSDEIGKESAEIRDAIARTFEAQVLTAQQKKIMAWRPVPPELSVPVQERATAVQPVIPGFNDEETVKARLDSGDAFQADGTTYGVTQQMVDFAVGSGDKSTLEQTVENAVAAGQKEAYGYYGDILRSRFNNDEAAVVWYRKGAEAGEPYAQFQLGKSYCEGRGVENPDISACYGWMLTAMEGANPNFAPVVRNALVSIEGGALPDELKKGQELAEKNKAALHKEEPKKATKSGLFNLF